MDRTVQYSMRRYVKQTLDELKHIFTGKHYYAPSKIDRPDYGAKVQFAKIDTATPLTLTQIKYIKRVIGRFLYYARAIDNAMLHALNAIASSKSKGTQTTWKAVKYFLNYAAINPTAEIIFRASDMFYKIDSDAAYLVCPEARSGTTILVMQMIISSMEQSTYLQKSSKMQCRPQQNMKWQACQ